ncbi:MAG: hypothetical protein V7K25_15170 [Nostoc sp.]|uniref:hypothetical protein n=1 Tax=Nostoc sp. TaxID=1180 RepID=UPI002FFC7616
MFHKILVAINDTEIGQQVFKETLSLATATNAELSFATYHLTCRGWRTKSFQPTNR